MTSDEEYRSYAEKCIVETCFQLYSRYHSYELEVPAIVKSVGVF